MPHLVPYLTLSMWVLPRPELLLLTPLLLPPHAYLFVLRP